jgi:hypothetical protein
VQGVSSTFLYNGRAVDYTILPAFNEISNSQARPTEITCKACDHLMDYLTTHPNAAIRLYASGMCLCIFSNAAYLVLPDDHSHCAGLFFLSDHSTTNPPQTSTIGDVRVLFKPVRETIVLFMNAREAINIITALEEMGHKQPLR